MHQASSLGALLASLGGLYYEFNEHPKLFFLELLMLVPLLHEDIYCCSLVHLNDFIFDNKVLVWLVGRRLSKGRLSYICRR